MRTSTTKSTTFDSTTTLNTSILNFVFPPNLLLFEQKNNILFLLKPQYISYNKARNNEENISSSIIFIIDGLHSYFLPQLVPPPMSALFLIIPSLRFQLHPLHLRPLQSQSAEGRLHAQTGFENRQGHGQQKHQNSHSHQIPMPWLAKYKSLIFPRKDRIIKNTFNNDPEPKFNLDWNKPALPHRIRHCKMATNQNFENKRVWNPISIPRPFLHKQQRSYKRHCDPDR